MISVDKLIGHVTGPIYRTPVGLDLSVDAIYELTGTGRIGHNVASLPTYCELPLVDGTWQLAPGIYQVRCMQGLRCTDHLIGRVVQRSSLSRCGALVQSAIYDPGYETGHIHFELITFRPISIDSGARVATYIAEEYSGTSTYEGHYNHEH